MEGFNTGFLRQELRHIEHRGHRVIKRQKRRAIENHKEYVATKQEQMSQLVAKLYEKVQEDAFKNDYKVLRSIIKEHEREFGMLDDKSADYLCDYVLLRYEENHKKVNSYYGQYKEKPAELFELCFGKKPQGQIELVLGPMTLCFRCFDEEDYIFAYLQHSNVEDQASKAESQRERASRSQGCALSKVKIEELDDLVIMEKASNNSVIEGAQVDVKKTELEKNKPTRIKFEDLDKEGKLYWNMKNKGWVFSRCEFSFKRSENKITEISLFNDITGNYCFYNRPVSPPFSYRFDLSQGKGAATEFVDMAIDSEGISFVDSSSKSHAIEQEVVKGGRLVIKDQPSSNETRIHEEQHQFNKLLIPLEDAYSLSPHVASLEKMLNDSDRELVEAAKSKLIARLAKYYRRMYIDGRARDEIIAFYKEGQSTDRIAKILKTGTLYDYSGFSEKEKDAPSLHKFIEDNIFYDLGQGGAVNRILYNDSPESKRKYAIDLKFPIKEGFFTKPEVEEVVNRVLKDDYHVSIDTWLDQIKKLEQLGYPRLQIDRKSTRLNSSHSDRSRMPSSA